MNDSTETDYTPRPKVVAASVGAACAVLIAWLASLAGVEMPNPVQGALTVLLTFGFGYMKAE